MQAQQIMGLTEQLRLAQQDCSSSHQHLHAKGIELQQLQARHADLQEARHLLQQQLSGAHDKLAALEADQVLLQQDVLQLSSRNTTLHMDLEERESAVQQLSEQLAALQQDAQEVRGESQSQIKKLTAEQEELESRAGAMSCDLASAKEELEALRARVDQQDQENDQLQVSPCCNCGELQCKALMKCYMHMTIALTLRRQPYKCFPLHKRALPASCIAEKNVLTT